MATPKDDSLQAGLYKQFKQANSYAKQEGLVVMGCADGAPVVVRAIKPYGVRTQAWSAEKERTPPVFPAPAPDDANSTLIAKQYTVPLPTPVPGPNPHFVFSMSGTFTYLENDPTDEQTGFPGAKMPFTVPVLYAAATAAGNLNPLGAVVGGAGVAAIMSLQPRFAEGHYTWPFTHVSTGFADPTLSQTFTVDTAGTRTYTLDTLGRG